MGVGGGAGVERLAMRGYAALGPLGRAGSGGLC